MAAHAPPPASCPPAPHCTAAFPTPSCIFSCPPPSIPTGTGGVSQLGTPAAREPVGGSAGTAMRRPGSAGALSASSAPSQSPMSYQAHPLRGPGALTPDHPLRGISRSPHAPGPQTFNREYMAFAAGGPAVSMGLVADTCREVDCMGWEGGFVGALPSDLHTGYSGCWPGSVDWLFCLQGSRTWRMQRPPTAPPACPQSTPQRRPMMTCPSTTRW